MLANDRDGKVTQMEYDLNKVAVIYVGIRKQPSEGIAFKEALVSRQFFDAADLDKDGKLSPVEILDALPFEAVDKERKGYFGLTELQRYMKSIAR